MKYKYFSIFDLPKSKCAMLSIHKLKPNLALLIVLFTLILGNCMSYFFEYSVFPKVTKLITVTILLTFYYCQLHKLANVFLTTFLLFFIGDAFSVFEFGDLSLKLSKASYISAYALLIFVLFGQLKKLKFDGLVSVYLILVLLLNSYFLYALYGVAKDNFVDEVNLFLYVCHGVTLIAMTFFAFAVYLSRETAQSITFLLMVFSFVFADVLYYICQLYVYYWIFELFESILHISGMFLLYKYVYDHHTIRNKEEHIKFSEYFIPTTEVLRQIRVHF